MACKESRMTIVETTGWMFSAARSLIGLSQQGLAGSASISHPCAQATAFPPQRAAGNHRRQQAMRNSWRWATAADEALTISDRCSIESRHQPRQDSGRHRDGRCKDVARQLAQPAVIAKSQQGRADTTNACSASFTLRFQYRAMERTDELPLTPRAIGQLALEAALRDVKMASLSRKL
jgi:hypothetical protein